MQFEKLEVHLHGVAEFGMAILDGSEFGRLTCVSPTGPWGTGYVIGHCAIIHKLPVSDFLP
jgi:hypothetical protein